jgi:flagellar motor switch protein FliN/FliY
MSASNPQFDLAEATARAIADVLNGLGIADVGTGKPGIVERGSNPLEILPMPAVISRVAYIGGVSGGNVFATTVTGANTIAAAMGAGNDPNAAELSDIAQSAFEEAANQMLSAAAGATARVLGRTVEIGPPQTSVVDTAPDVTDVAAPHMTRVSLTVAGETCLFVQLIPQVFVMRMTAALADSDSFSFDEALGGPTLDSEWVHATSLRLDAELGSAQLTADEVLGLADGAVVVLDRAVDDPIELFVNGMPYGTGRLLVDEGEWAVAIEQLTTLSISEDGLSSPESTGVIFEAGPEVEINDDAAVDADGVTDGDDDGTEGSG